jgi:linoleoyl-CoA desaturase
VALSLAKILENMEIGHNVMHGQWDWMRDPEIHSSTWEWDNVSSAEGWKHSHNYQHHMFANVVGKDRDLGYEIMRVDPDQPWHPVYLAQPIYNLVLAAVFEWGVALHDLEIDEVRRGRKPWSAAGRDLKRLARKAGKQVIKDYVVWPVLSGPSAVPAFLGSLGANVVRNAWSHAVIFCGHFPDGAQTFDYTEEQLEGETRGDWYVRQLLGSANLDGGRLFHVMAGNLSFQIEHHLFPDVPSNRYQEISPRVREICERYGLPYTSGPLHRQYAQVLIKIARYAFPGGASSESPAPRDQETDSPAPIERALKATVA